jgi:hypothetical protein
MSSLPQQVLPSYILAKLDPSSDPLPPSPKRSVPPENLTCFPGPSTSPCPEITTPLGKFSCSGSVSCQAQPSPQLHISAGLVYAWKAGSLFSLIWALTHILLFIPAHLGHSQLHQVVLHLPLHSQPCYPQALPMWRMNQARCTEDRLTE